MTGPTGATGPTGVTAIVLAGGASSRFGTDKLAADLNGAPVLHHALRAVAAVADDIVLALAPGAAEPPMPQAMARGVSFARDAEAFGGPLAGVAAGLAVTVARDHPPRIVLVAGGDMAWMRPEVLLLLVERLRADPHLAAITLDASPAAPLPMAMRPGAVHDALASCLADGRRSLRALLLGLPAATVPTADWRPLDPDGLTLRDIDTPGDLPAG